MTQAVAGATTESYAYDQEGKRIRKVSGATTTNFHYMGPDIYAEYGTTFTAQTAITTHGPNWDDPILRQTGTGHSHSQVLSSRWVEQCRCGIDGDRHDRWHAALTPLTTQTRLAKFSIRYLMSGSFILYDIGVLAYGRVANGGQNWKLHRVFLNERRKSSIGIGK